MADVQTNFRAGDMLGAPKVTATPATIAKSVAPKKPVAPVVAEPVVEEVVVVEEAPVADVEVDEEA